MLSWLLSWFRRPPAVKDTPPSYNQDIQGARHRQYLANLTFSEGRMITAKVLDNGDLEVTFPDNGEVRVVPKSSIMESGYDG